MQKVIRRLLGACLAATLACGCTGKPAGHPPDPQVAVHRIPGTVVEFTMVGIPDADLWIGRHEVTWDEYLLYCAWDETTPPGTDGIARPSRPLETFPYDYNWGTGRRPAVGVSRSAAQGYCAWSSVRTGRTYRLPTEDEWREACGDAPPDIEAAAWCEENSGAKTHEVGEKAPNRFGVHDMLGNLWEYCEGSYSSDDPEQPVLRGGAWDTPSAEISPEARLAFDADWTLRDPNYPPGLWWVPDGDHLGFRIVWEGDQP